MLLLQSHYRSPVARRRREPAGRRDARVAGLDAFAARSASVADDADDADPAVLDAFVAAMDDDLDTPGGDGAAVRHRPAGQHRRSTAATTRPGALVAAVREIAGAFGLELGRAGDVPADVLEQAAALDAARAAKDYAAADAIRAELQADGWIVETIAGRDHRPA